MTKNFINRSGKTWLSAIRLVTGGGTRIYRFAPQFDYEGSSTDIAFFAFSVPWEPRTERVELIGPSHPGDPELNQDMVLFTREWSAQAPVVNTLRAGIDTAPNFGGPQTDPPILSTGHDVVIAWDATDVDSEELRTALLLDPPPSPEGYDGWLPFGIELEETKFTIPYELLADVPGVYSGRVVVSDGINSTTYDQEAPFIVGTGQNVYLPIILHNR